jgi:hypothetical protein
MIQSKLIMAVNEASPEVTDRISAMLGLKPDDEPDTGTTIQVLCCECDTYSWHHLDQFNPDALDIVIHCPVCDEDSSVIQAYRDMGGSYISDGDIDPISDTMISDLEMWRGSQS